MGRESDKCGLAAHSSSWESHMRNVLCEISHMLEGCQSGRAVLTEKGNADILTADCWLTAE